MRENDLPFREVNIMEDYAAAYALVNDGIRSVPVLELEDGTRYLGAADIQSHL
jgi:glutaredoxin